MSGPVKLERVHYREFISTLNRTRAICHECKVSWPCLEAQQQAGAASWWYVSPQQLKGKPDREA